MKIVTKGDHEFNLVNRMSKKEAAKLRLVTAEIFKRFAGKGVARHRINGLLVK